MKIFSLLILNYDKPKKAETVFYALKPDNVLTKKNMVIKNSLEGSSVKIVIEIKDGIEIISTLHNTLNEILAHTRSIENLLKKIK